MDCFSFFLKEKKINFGCAVSSLLCVGVFSRCGARASQCCGSSFNDQGEVI